MQNYLEGWLVVWLLIVLVGLTAILLDEGVPEDRTERILLTPMVAVVGAYLAIPFASVGTLLLAPLR
jgi:uncharacterized membrane protein